MENQFTQYEDHLAKFQEAISNNSFAHAEYMYGLPVKPEGYDEYKKAQEKELLNDDGVIEKFKQYEEHVKMFSDAVNSNSYEHACNMYGFL